MPPFRLLAVPLALWAALAATGCSSNAQQTTQLMGNLPADAPPPPAVQPPFPNVYDTRPQRPTKLMSEREQARIEAELEAARDRVDAKGNALQKQRTGGSR